SSPGHEEVLLFWVPRIMRRGNGMIPRVLWRFRRPGWAVCGRHPITDREWADASVMSKIRCPGRLLDTETCATLAVHSRSYGVMFSRAAAADSAGRRNHADFVIRGVGDEDRAISGHRYSGGRMELGTGGLAVIPAVARGPRPRDPGDHARRRNVPHHVVRGVRYQGRAVRGCRSPFASAELGRCGRTVIPAVARGPRPRDPGDHAGR